MPTLVAAVLPRTAFTLALLCGAAQAQIKISGLGESYAEPFDSLAASGTSSELPAGWVL